MTLAALGLALAAFVAALRLAGTLDTAAAAIAAARQAMRLLARPDLDDAAKEAASRQAAGRLFGAFLRIAGAGAAAFALAALVVWGGATAGLYPLDAALATASGWPFILGASLVVTLGWLAADLIAARRA